MTTRLAQLIAQAAKPDGTIDRARLFDALSVSPDDPVALVIEACLEVELGLARTRALDGKHLANLEAVFAAGSTQIRDALLGAQKDTQAGREAFAAAVAELRQERTATVSALAQDRDQVAATAGELAQLAHRIEEKVAGASRHLFAWCALSFLGGAVLALAFAFWRLAPAQ